MARVAALFRYPVKGLSAAPLDAVDLTAGCGVPFDRAFALARAATRFDADDPQWLHPAGFFQLKRDERLAGLATAFDPAASVLTVFRDGRQVVRGNLSQPGGRMVLEQFFDAWLKTAAHDRPRLVHAPGHSFADAPDAFVSLINLASVRDLERVAGRPIDPLRFRANVHLADLPAWTEFDWLGRTLAIGEVRLSVAARIVRCAAINVDPKTGARDMNLPAALQRGFGHIDMGVYARVTAGGRIAADAEVAPVS